MLAKATSRTKLLGDIWSRAPAQAAPVISKQSLDTPLYFVSGLKRHNKGSTSVNGEKGK